MPGRRILHLFVLSLAALFSLSVLAAPVFKSCEIEGEGSKLMFCDLDGDHLQDAILAGETNCSIFFQDPRQGFTRKPQIQCALVDRPSLVWPAQLGEKSALLAMTSDGVTEFDFTNRTDAPARRQIIQEQTIIPGKLDETEAFYFPMSAKTATGWPLLLVPVNGGLEVWQHDTAWHQAQFIADAMDSRIYPSLADPGYIRGHGLSLNVADVNGDGRDDLMLMRHLAGGREVFTLYLQDTNGLFNLEPAMIYTNTDDWHTALAWNDINGDGRVDLVKSTISDEPSFVPGLQSGKVLVAVYLADEHGHIPATPQQVFRKNDWSESLPVTDLDGDGFKDLVLGTIPIDSHDGVRQMITAGEITLNLRLHFFRPGAGFPKEPDLLRPVSLHIDRGLIWSLDERLYFEKFLSLNGDFNGDGKKDLLVRDHDDGMSVYFFNSRAIGFSARPDLKFACPEQMDWWKVEDLNGDGVSDLVVKLANQDVYRIFLSGKE